MAWTVNDRFPNWGETGESPADGFFYEGGDQVNEKHLDFLWNSVRGLEDDVQAALNDIDSNSDGTVDAADTAGTAGGATGQFELDGDLVAQNGEVIWDESATQIPQGRLQNDSVTINGTTVSLGGSTTIPTYSDADAISAINNDGDHGSTAQHNYYTDSQAVSAVDGSSLSSLNITGTFTDPAGVGHTTQLAETSDIPSSTALDGQQSTGRPSSWVNVSNQMSVFAYVIEAANTAGNGDLELDHPDGTTTVLAGGAGYVSVDKFVTVVRNPDSYTGQLEMNIALQTNHSHAI